MNKLFLQTNLHLSISSCIVALAAVSYGFFPEVLFQIKMQSANEHSVFKAIMGLYLAFSMLFVAGVYNQKYWKTASICTMLFMLGLGFGRIVAIVSDGFPSTLFIFGTIGELVLGVYAFIQLKSIKK